MIVIKQGDIFKSDCKVIVCPVNTVGVMGGGLALAFRQRWPEVEGFYLAKLAQGKLKINQPCLLFGHPYSKPPRPDILLFPTKEDWRNPSKYSYITNGLDYFLHVGGNIESIAFPLLGAGLGGLDPQKVYELMIKKLAPHKGLVEIYKN
jgi:O-acetyl-ADP-ribose deacetylase (regulator of RNase III)